MFRALLPVPLVRTRPTLLAACLALSLQAHAGSLHFQLPAQPLAASLSQIAQQAKIQLLFDEQLLRNAKAPALQGDFSPEEAIRQLLRNGQFSLVKVDNTYIVRPAETSQSSGSALQLGAMSVIGNGSVVDSSSVGRSTLNQAEIDRHQANNVVSLIDTLPGVSLGGSLKPGGQTINIWGLGDAEDVPITVDGATKSGFERYQQGVIFIEPELIRRVEVEKGPHSPKTGNGGFGGTVHTETKDAPDLLQDGRNVGAMVKYGYSSNDHQQAYTSAVYGRTDDHRFDALAYWTKRDGDDMKLASSIPDPRNQYLVNPKRQPNTAQDLDGQLFKLNMQLTDEQRLGFTYSSSDSDIWAPFSAKNYPEPPSKANIDKYGYDGATKRYLAQRNTIDTTWLAKYEYQPVDNPWVDLKVQYSNSKTDQTDERGPTAFYQPVTGGRKITVGYEDKILEVTNISRFSTGPLDHALTLGTQIRKHTREVDMWMPGKTYEVPKYNYGHYQPGFMPHGKVDNNAFYIQDAITLGDFTLTPSLRYDHVRNRGEENDAPLYNSSNPKDGHDYGDKTYTGWSPRLSAYWNVNPNLALFADYSKTWRAPVIDEQYEVQAPGSTRSSTSRNLDPERITALRAGTIHNFSKLLTDNDSAQIRTTVFQNKISDEILKATGIGCAEQLSTGKSIAQVCKESPMSVYRNIGDLTIKGFEVESYYDSTYLFGALSYSWITGKHQGAYTNPWGPNVWARDIPPRKWVATLGLKIPQWDAQVGWQGQWVRQTDRLPSDKYPSGPASDFGDSYWNQYGNDRYNVHGLFANWKPQQAYLKGTEVNFTLDNMFNRDYRPPLSGDNAYSLGRNAKISVTRFF
ncbi:TonB-dependent hemoglobin/transferrin/lactoferrin family receptor [Pseudomonas sp. MPFS]|uniref:TonB-dependent receptor n=1 Tax=Pseudomonas sp. MPFS TaxID=2795724 RepID=UPI001F12CA17|nr:TonB-dependent receptor [Pseudomonas sp. MPFS]UMZ13461.1 TonB-dependent hemoglobin/transferrin/lactoferrin family receptor [Pseudomonas sp. MPFS]